MPNIGTVIRDEISRLSRKESRNQVDATKKATTKHRKDIAELKRQVAQLQRQVSQLARRVLGKPEAESSAADAKGVRFAAKGLRSQRSRLGISQADLGMLLDVSAQTVYNWESGSTRPRAAQLVKLATLRGIGKREVAARLKQLVDANAKKRRKT